MPNEVMPLRNKPLSMRLNPPHQPIESSTRVIFRPISTLLNDKPCRPEWLVSLPKQTLPLFPLIHVKPEFWRRRSSWDFCQLWHRRTSPFF